MVHLSNLCTEIIEVSSDAETAVCNLGSVNLAAHLTDGGIDWERLRATVRTAVTFLDRVIDINYYPTPQAAASNPRWRPVGLGLMGLQDVFFALRLPFDSPAARELSTRISEEIYLTALETSADLAARFGAHPAYGADPGRARASCNPTCGVSRARRPRAGPRCASGSRRTGCATRCWWRSRRPRPSPRSPAATSASSRRCPTCSSARRCRGSSSRSTRLWSAS